MGYAILASNFRGVVQRKGLALDFENNAEFGEQPLVKYAMLSHTPGWNPEKLHLKGDFFTASSENPSSEVLKSAVLMLAKIMREDSERRAAGEFDDYWNAIVSEKAIPKPNYPTLVLQIHTPLG